jgi:hypothetical protein
MQLSYGTGSMWGARTDAVIGTTPDLGSRQFAVLQNCKIECSFETTKLYGTKQFPIAIARGPGTVTGTAEFARILALTFGDLFWGQTTSTGQLGVAHEEAATIPATPFTVTVANGATFAYDLAVIYTTTGRFLERVAATPTVGQYTVNFTTGAYVFAAADTGLGVKISYQYNVVASGKKITMTNQLLGTTPTFSMLFSNPISPFGIGGSAANAPVALRLNACTASKLGMISSSVTDFNLQNFEFEAFADASDIIGYYSSVE